MAAGLEHLARCPKCPYACIAPPGATVLECQNPDCLAETCVKCQRPAHVPLRCDEAREAESTDARVFLEERLSDALVLECPRCRNRFVKGEGDGCNLVKCPCFYNKSGGAGHSFPYSVCWVCKADVSGPKPYTHFVNKPPGCVLYGNDKATTAQRLLAEGRRAIDEVNKKRQEELANNNNGSNNSGSNNSNNNNNNNNNNNSSSNSSSNNSGGGGAGPAVQYAQADAARLIAELEAAAKGPVTVTTKVPYVMVNGAPRPAAEVRAPAPVRPKPKKKRKPPAANKPPPTKKRRA
jgi:hypothetical protein